eukprot:1146797-Pelagomonas_calceolata.AAC.1
MGRWWSDVGSRGMDDIRRMKGGACGLGAGHGVHFMCRHNCGSKGCSCWAWLSLVGRLAVLTQLFEGLELQSFSYHLALFLIAGPVFFLCLPYFSHSELRGGEVIQSVH